MRIAVHDYAGHHFQLDLSRELAARGHQVLHLYCAGLVGPRGAVAPAAGDPPSLRIEGVGIGRTFSKYSPFRRFVDEVAYGRAAAARIRAFDPRAVLSANTPLLSQKRLVVESRRARRRFVYWWQDSYGVGAGAVARRHRPVLAPVLAWPFVTLERRLLAASDRVVAISEALRSQAVDWGVDPGRVDVVPNWAPLDEIVPGPSENAWKEAHGLAGAPLVVYAGTLGLKHDPTLLVELAEALRQRGARVAVVSEGPGRRLLEERRRSLDLDNLVLLDYQPAASLGHVLSAADVVVALLEADAGTFSVPSKVLSYLCAGRPVVASLPRENQAAQVLEAAGGGVCVSPGDRHGFVAAVEALLDDPDERQRLGRNGRRWAERHFDRCAVVERFERALAGPRPPASAGPARVLARTLRRIWGHPGNRHRRGRALARYFAWQAWERIVRTPWTLTLVPGRRIRCHPHSSSAAAVLYYRLPDPMEMRFLLDYLDDGDVFVDVGANLGVYTLLASSVPGVRVVALEPSTEAFARLRENLELNHLDGRVTSLRVAAGAAPGEARLSRGLDAMNAIVDGAGPSEPVEVVTVDAVAAEHGLAPVTAVKVDVEGMELEVLAGGARTIADDRPALLVEVNDPERLRSFALRNGYTCVRYDPPRRLLEPVDVGSCEDSNALLVADVDEAGRRLRRRP